jgi:signal-induced proliferation-associated 1 like protein 3
MVMEEAVAVPVVPVPVVPVPVVPVPVVPVLVVPVVAAFAVAGVVMPSLPQAVKATDSAAMTHKSLPLKMIPRKVSYIALLPEAVNAAVRWFRRR